MAAVQKRRAAPQARYNTQADTVHVVLSTTVTAADVNLLRIAGKPKFAPQRITIVNTIALATGTTAVLVITPEKGANLTVSVPAGCAVAIDHPVKALVDTGSSGTFEVHCYWWDASTLDWNAEA